MIGKSGIVADKLLKEALIRQLVSDNKPIVDSMREHAIGALMGIAMKRFRGNISGSECNRVLTDAINHYLNNTCPHCYVIRPDNQKDHHCHELAEFGKLDGDIIYDWYCKYCKAWEWEW